MTNESTAQPASRPSAWTIATVMCLLACVQVIFIVMAANSMLGRTGLDAIIVPVLLWLALDLYTLTRIAIIIAKSRFTAESCGSTAFMIMACIIGSYAALWGVQTYLAVV